jgi:hypothetical protein
MKFFTMDILQLTGQNLGRVFKFRFGHLHAELFWCYQVKLPNLKLKTRPKQLLGSLPLVIALTVFNFLLIIEGDTDKVLQFTVALKSINDKNVDLCGAKMYL